MTQYLSNRANNLSEKSRLPRVWACTAIALAIKRPNERIALCRYGVWILVSHRHGVVSPCAGEKPTTFASAGRIIWSIFMVS
jgi:hypothetical protein